jgi:virulence-associated protein VapD
MQDVIDRSIEISKANHFRSHVDFNLIQKTETKGNSRVYAIAFDMDIESLKQSYGDPYNNAYTEIRKVLQSHGFSPQQGSVYFGDSTVNAVTCVLAAQDLARKLPWFSSSVRDIRMLRIEEFNDLGPAVQTIG